MNCSKLAGVAVAVLALSAAAAELKEINVNHMIRGYCFAGSRTDTKAPGGFGSSDNAPQKLGGRTDGTNGAISLVALPQESATFGKSYRGFRLLLVNRTKSEAAFRASDSRLSIIQEARDEKGEWRPIEYLPSSWCGNSYHKVFLPAGKFWEFAAPAYTGSFKTRLRFVLQGETPIYSNEFEGRINPAQFTQKQGHTPSNLMDPYLE